MINENCVTFVCNGKYLKYALFVANQFLTKKNIDFDIVICSGEDLSSSIPNGISFIQINVDDFTKNLPTIPRLQQYTYWRIPAIEELSKKYKRIIYLDTDIFVNRDGISSLLHIDMKSKVLAAVRDVHQSTRPKRIPKEYASLGIPYRPYFNAGVLMIDGAAWINQNCFLKIKEISKTHKNILFCHDQSLLNLMTDGKWIQLSPVWNWQYNYKNCFLTEVVSPRLIHFIGSSKIWNEPDGMVPDQYRDEYLSYIDNTYIPSIKNRNINSNTSIKLIKNIWYYRKYNKYLSNFESDLSTIDHN